MGFEAYHTMGANKGCTGTLHYSGVDIALFQGMCGEGRRWSYEAPALG